MGLLLAATGALAQERAFDWKNEFSGYAEYSNDSSHMLIGQSENRKLLEVGVGYERRLKENRVAAWRWEIDVKPLVLLRNPVLTTDETVTLLTPVVGYAGLLPGTYHFVNLQSRECRTASGTGFFEGVSASGQVVNAASYTFSSTCANPWTYGGAISPLGQTVNFRPRKSLQPYVAANAGFVAFSKVTPSNNATMFNFSFEVGAGAQYFVRPGRAIGVDLRFHHISNAYRGMENPGVDSALAKVSYSFGR